MSLSVLNSLNVNIYSTDNIGKVSTASIAALTTAQIQQLDKNQIAALSSHKWLLSVPRIFQSSLVPKFRHLLPRKLMA